MKSKHFRIICLLTAFLFWGSALAQKTVDTEDLRMRDPFISVDREHDYYYIITSRLSECCGGLFALRSRDLKNL